MIIKLFYFMLISSTFTSLYASSSDLEIVDQYYYADWAPMYGFNSITCLFGDFINLGHSGGFCMGMNKFINKDLMNYTIVNPNSKLCLYDGIKTCCENFDFNFIGSSKYFVDNETVYNSGRCYQGDKDFAGSFKPQFQNNF